MLPLLPIFLVGVFPMLLLSLLGFAGLVILGMLLICVGLSDGLDANSDLQPANHRPRLCAPAPNATVQASNLHSAMRFATLMIVAGAG